MSDVAMAISTDADTDVPQPRDDVACLDHLAKCPMIVTS